jgi:hypothetical protein
MANLQVLVQINTPTFTTNQTLIVLWPVITPNYYYYYYYYVSCHRPILPGNSLEPTVIPTVQASSFTLQYFLHYV